MDYLLAMEHVERLARDIRRNEQCLLQADIHHKNTVKAIFKIMKNAVIHLTHPINIDNLYYEENGLVHGGVCSIHYLEDHHPSDKDTLYVSRYEKGGVEEYTISVSPVLVHATGNMVFCTDPNIERSVVADHLVVDGVNRTINEIHKTLLLINSIPRSDRP